MPNYLDIVVPGAGVVDEMTGGHGQETVEDALEAASDAADGVWDDITDAFDDAWNTVTGWLSDAWCGIKSWFGGGCCSSLPEEELKVLARLRGVGLALPAWNPKDPAKIVVCSQGELDKFYGMTADARNYITSLKPTVDGAVRRFILYEDTGGGLLVVNPGEERDNILLERAKFRTWIDNKTPEYYEWHALWDKYQKQVKGWYVLAMEYIKTGEEIVLNPPDVDPGSMGVPGGTGNAGSSEAGDTGGGQVPDKPPVDFPYYGPAVAEWAITLAVKAAKSGLPLRISYKTISPAVYARVAKYQGYSG